MSTLNVDKVDPNTGTALEIGSSGDTISIPSGATLDISASTLTPPATMPASSGINLTALNATNLGSGTVPTARLGTGTASSSTVLYGDQTYKAEPSGVALTGSTDNTVVTVTGADAIQGEASMTYNGTTLELTTSGGGLKLDNLDSTDAHTLDDYEEGQFTLEIEDASDNALPLANQTANYTKIGRMITFCVFATCTSLASASGNLTLKGLPFTSKATRYTCGISSASVYNTTGHTGGLTGIIPPSAVIINAQAYNATGNYINYSTSLLGAGGTETVWSGWYMELA